MRAEHPELFSHMNRRGNMPVSWVEYCRAADCGIWSAAKIQVANSEWLSRPLHSPCSSCTPLRPQHHETQSHRKSAESKVASEQWLWRSRSRDTKEPGSMCLTSGRIHERGKTPNGYRCRAYGQRPSAIAKYKWLVRNGYSGLAKPFSTSRHLSSTFRRTAKCVPRSTVHRCRCNLRRSMESYPTINGWSRTASAALRRPCGESRRLRGHLRRTTSGEVLRACFAPPRACQEVWECCLAPRASKERLQGLDHAIHRNRPAFGNISQDWKGGCTPRARSHRTAACHEAWQSAEP